MPAHQADDAVVPACGPDDLVVEVSWERDGTGLRGRLVAANVSDRACKLAGKPDVTPLGADGTPLPARTVMTLELRNPGYVILQPGQRAVAPVWWASWCGQHASDRAQVGWPGGSARARWPPPSRCLRRATRRAAARAASRAARRVAAHPSAPTRNPCPRSP